MASLIHKLTKNVPSLRSLKAHICPKPTPSLISHNSYLGPPRLEYADGSAAHLGPGSFHYFESLNSFPIFPNFPFGYCLNPIPSTGLEHLHVCEAVEVDTGDAKKIWADSVKKKRKKKMNKHKYKKLRKRLRRKSRA